jgi:hypothetical protein
LRGSAGFAPDFLFATRDKYLKAKFARTRSWKEQDFRAATLLDAAGMSQPLALDATFRRVYFRAESQNLRRLFMKRSALWASVVVVLLAAFAAAQAQPATEDYLDIYTVQVKQEKRAEFDAVNKKMVAANRQNNGDTWLAIETVYGPINRITFISTRQSYADAEKGMGAFTGAIEKSLGKAGSEKLYQDFLQCLVSGRTEIRRRRWDLSSNAPTSPADFAKQIAGTRYLRTTAVHVRPGKGPAFEEILKDLKTAREKSNAPMTVLVSQSVVGQEGTVYYVSTLANSMGGFDGLPSAQQSLGDSGYEKFLKDTAETVSNTEVSINRFVPELSNAPSRLRRPPLTSGCQKPRPL